MIDKQHLEMLASKAKLLKAEKDGIVGVVTAVNELVRTSMAPVV
jgi:hypothetical protein